MSNTVQPGNSAAPAAGTTASGKALNGKKSNGNGKSGNGNDDDQPPPVVLARPFRSRKNRPCDGCRRAKTRCAITEVGTPCVECQHTRKKCTFDELPRERKRPPKRSLSPLELTIDSEQVPYASAPKRARTNGNHSSAAATATGSTTKMGNGAVLGASGSQNNGDEQSHAGPSRSKECANGKEPVSLEETRGYHVVTAVLTDDLLPVGARKAGCEGDEHIRQMSLDASKPQYVIFSKKSEKQRQREDTLFSITSALSLLHPPPNPQALLDLYINSHNSAFPILPPPKHVFASQSRRSASMAYTPEHPYPPALMPKIYTAALNHTVHYRTSVKGVRKILVQQQQQQLYGVHGFGSGIPRSSLSSISDALMDISARPAENAEENYIILARATAQAQLLGLHIDPSNWAIPSWEKDCRRVLWWALRVHDGWASFLNSRPSHIQGNNHTVALPTAAMILAATQLHQSPQVVSSPVVANPATTLVPSPSNAPSSTTGPAQGHRPYGAAAPTASGTTHQGPHPQHQPHRYPHSQPQQPPQHHPASVSVSISTSPVTASNSTTGVISRASSPTISRSRSQSTSLPLQLRSPSVLSSISPSSPRQTRPLNPNAALHSAQSFSYLCRLAIIVSRLQTQVCTLMASREDRLGRVVEIEKEVEVLLGEVREFVKSDLKGQEKDQRGEGDSMETSVGNGMKMSMEGAGSASGFPSLMTCLLGFRCMARRIAIELSIGLGSPFTPDPETLERYAQAVEYISSLDGPAFDGFWLVHVGHILSSVTSSLIRLSLATTNSMPSPLSSTMPSPTDTTHPSHTHTTSSTNGHSTLPHPLSSIRSTERQRHALLQVTSRTNPIFLLCRLRHALQKARDVYHWDLADAALARADNVAVCLESVGEEYEHVVRALRGTLFDDGSRGQANGGQSYQRHERARAVAAVMSGEASPWRATERGSNMGGGDAYGVTGSKMNGNGIGVQSNINGSMGFMNGDADSLMNWNIDLNLFGMGLDWTGFEGFEGMPTVGLSPDYGFASS